MKDLLKVGQVLDRSEMKKIMAGSGGTGNCSACCESHSGQGCGVTYNFSVSQLRNYGYCDGQPGEPYEVPC